jgi:hypothetical protein
MGGITESRTPWLWVAVGTWTTQLMIQLGCDKPPLQALLDVTFTGRVTSDRLAVYNRLPMVINIDWSGKELRYLFKQW